jgi:predicted nuclease of predicted toxin-antitoxin system
MSATGRMQTASDAAIWDYALATSAVIVTKDEDFQERRDPLYVSFRSSPTSGRPSKDGR